MIAFVKGIIEEVYDDHVVIDNNGFGINIYVTTSDASDLVTSIGTDAKLFTYTAVREDAFLLYGFLDKEALNFFKKLITVNGVGPKGAMGVLSGMNLDDLRYSILQGDVKLLSKAPGIGKKTAERIILDLKDKLSWDDSLINREVMTTNKDLRDNENPLYKDAVDALIALGYNAKEAANAVKKTDINEDTTLEDIIKSSLSELL